MDNQRMMVERQIELLMAQSTDSNYTQYLMQLLYRLRRREVTTEFAVSEVNRTYQIYMQWQMLQNRTQQPQAVQMQDGMQQVQTRQMSENVPQVQTIQSPAVKKNVEFTIGAWVLSIVGVLFVLTAFVMLGLTYMNGMVKGLCLYGIALAVLLVSELLLNRKMPKFAVGITGLGIGGLYLATLLNYLYLENFSAVAAVSLTLAVSILTVFISRRKDSGIIRIVSFMGCYICILTAGAPFFGVTAGEGASALQLLLTTVILFLVNGMTLLLPVKSNQTVVHIVHMASNCVFSIVLAVMAFIYMEEEYYVLFFLLAAILTQGLIASKANKAVFRHTDTESAGIGIFITYLVSEIVLALVLLAGSFYVLVTEMQIVVHITTGFFWLLCAGMSFLLGKSSMKWLPYWIGTAYTLILYWCGGVFVDIGYYILGNAWPWYKLGVILAVFLVAKLLSRVKELRISELLITVYTALQAVMVFWSLDLEWYENGIEKQAAVQNFTASLCYLTVFLLSVTALHYWKVVYEEIVVVVFLAFICMNLQNVMMPALLMGVLLMAVVGYNNIEFCRDKYIRIGNYINLGVATALYIGIAFVQNHLLYGIMLLLGISFLVLTFREKYGMNFKVRNLVLVLFLCYMAVIWKMPVSVLKSVILMLIAIAAVIAGFVIKEKKLRVTGLGLTLAVCGKIVVYDFAGLENVEKMILFLCVGVIVLAISGIYIALEKKIV